MRRRYLRYMMNRNRQLRGRVQDILMNRHRLVFYCFFLWTCCWSYRIYILFCWFLNFLPILTGFSWSTGCSGFMSCAGFHYLSIGFLQFFWFFIGFDWRSFVSLVFIVFIGAVLVVIDLLQFEAQKTKRRRQQKATDNPVSSPTAWQVPANRENDAHSQNKMQITGTNADSRQQTRITYSATCVLAGYRRFHYCCQSSYCYYFFEVVCCCQPDGSDCACHCLRMLLRLLL